MEGSYSAGYDQPGYDGAYQQPQGYAGSHSSGPGVQSGYQQGYATQPAAAEGYQDKQSRSGGQGGYGNPQEVQGNIAGEFGGGYGNPQGGYANPQGQGSTVFGGAYGNQQEGQAAAAGGGYGTQQEGHAGAGSGFGGGYGGNGQGSYRGGYNNQQGRGSGQGGRGNFRGGFNGTGSYSEQGYQDPKGRGQDSANNVEGGYNAPQGYYGSPGGDSGQNNQNSYYGSQGVGRNNSQAYYGSQGRNSGQGGRGSGFSEGSYGLQGRSGGRGGRGGFEVGHGDQGGRGGSSEGGYTGRGGRGGGRGGSLEGGYQTSQEKTGDQGGPGGITEGGYGSRPGRAGGSVNSGGGYDSRTQGFSDSRSGGNSGRQGDWTCTNPSCGNVNFARRFECNKCGASKPAGSGQSNQYSDQSGGYNSGASRGGYNEKFRGGRGAASGDSIGNEQGSKFQDFKNDGGRDHPRADETGVKQCDENCGDDCENTRIYISGLPLDATIEELRNLFGGIGQVARLKQKRGYKDQWPWSIKLYTDESGQNKGDAVLTYEDPSAAHSAGGFFNDYVLRGSKITVTMAEKSAPRPDQRGSRGGGFGNNRGFASGGPDRRDGGGHRSRPY